MKDLTNEFNNAYDALARLDRTLEKARTTCAEGEEAEEYLDEAEKVIEDSEGRLRHAQKQLTGLSKQVKEDLAETKEIGSRVNPLFEKLDGLIN